MEILFFFLFSQVPVTEQRGEKSIELLAKYFHRVSGQLSVEIAIMTSDNLDSIS